MSPKDSGSPVPGGEQPEFSLNTRWGGCCGQAVAGGALSIPGRSQHSDSGDRATLLGAKEPDFCKTRCHQVGRAVLCSDRAGRATSGGSTSGGSTSGGAAASERARLCHSFVAGRVQLPGAVPVQRDPRLVAVAQDRGFPAAQAPGGVGSAQPGPGAAPAAPAAARAEQEVPAEEQVDPGVAAAAEAGQQHGDAESHVGGVWQGNRER